MLSRLRAVGLAAAATTALGGPLSSGASAFRGPAASPGPPPTQTYHFALDGAPFGFVVVNTKIHQCSFTELPRGDIEVTRARCSVGSGEGSISGSLRFNSSSELLPGEFTIVFTAYRHPLLGGYSGLGLELYRFEGTKATTLASIQLTP